MAPLVLVFSHSHLLGYRPVRHSRDGPAEIKIFDYFVTTCLLNLLEQNCKGAMSRNSD